MLSPELARHIASLSREIGRQIGVLVDRKGQVTHTFVGEPKRIYLPDIGRHRAGGQLRGLRHIHTVLDDSGLAREDLVDLTKLRLDSVCALEVTDDGEPGGVEYAHILPEAKDDERYRREMVPSVHDLADDYGEQISALEKEMARRTKLRRAGDTRPAAVVVGIYPDRPTSQWRLAELQELADTAGVEVAATMTQIRQHVDPKYVVGRGKLEEVVLKCLDLDAEMIIIDHNMSPAQARAIAAFSDLKVIDRTQLILDIFAQHAQSRDGKLQVELAQLKYNLPRLTDLDAGLSRLAGGIGGQGPGETKLEINRRRARDRITRLEREIEKLSQERSLRRSQRERSSVPVVSIVGYTNAGKSTLLNQLTNSRVEVADQLFATLDPASRRLRFPRDHEAVITDTVGFIRDLPPDLIKAFRATLEELESADLLLHVVDVADPAREEKMKAVQELLRELDLGSIPTITVFNKCDKVESWEANALAIKHHGVAVSAAEGQGLKRLVQLVAHRLWQSEVLAEDDPWAAAARQEFFGRSPQPASEQVNEELHEYSETSGSMVPRSA